MWGYRDANNTVYLGEPSARALIINATAGSASVSLTFSVPTDVTSTSYFYQIYRSPLGASITTDPGDDMNLVFESNHVVGTTTYTKLDSQLDIFRAAGTLLYTNPNSGQGITQANSKPPLAKDIALFRNNLFFANTQGIQNTQFNMLSAANFTSGTTKFIIANSSKVRGYTFTGSTQVQNITITQDGATSAGLYLTGNSAEPESVPYYFWFTTGASTDPAPTGRVGISTTVAGGDTAAQVATKLKAVIDAMTDFNCVDNGGGSLTITLSKNGVATAFAAGTTATTIVAPSTYGIGSAYNTNTAHNFATTDVDTGTEIITITAHGFVTGEALRFTSTVGLPAGITAGTTYYAANVTTNTIQLSDTLLHAIASSNIVNITTTGTGTHTATPVDNGNILLSNSASIGTAIDVTARSLVRAINLDSNGICYAYYLSGPADLPGLIRLEARNLSDSQFLLSIIDSGPASSSFYPALPLVATESSINTGTDVITTGTHNFATGDQIFAYGKFQTDYKTDTAPTLFGLYYVTVASPTTFKLSSTLGGAYIDITADFTVQKGYFFETTFYSTNDENQHYLYFSKDQQFESVPLVNFIPVGSKSSPISRIIALRDAIYVLKNGEGVYQVTGTTANPATGGFSASPYDLTISIIAPDTATTLNNQIYFLSQSGVARVSDVGVELISTDIKDKIDEVTHSGFSFATASFGLGYNTDRAYLLFLPTVLSDTTATQCYRYNPFNLTWTRMYLDKNYTCGLITSINATVNPDQLFLGNGDRAYGEKERKNLNRTDYADLQYDITLNIGSLDYDNQILALPSVSNVEIGDVIVQSQYVSIARFNRLLKQLDSDPLLATNTYFSLLAADYTSNMNTNITNLVTKLNVDDNTTLANFTFLDAAVNTGTNIITKSGHALQTGYRVQLSNAGGALPVPFLPATNYYAIVLSTTTFQLAATPQLCQAGTAIDITSAAGAGTHTLQIQNKYNLLNSPATTILQLGQNFNQITSLLDMSTGTYFRDYPQLDLSYTLEFEAIISDVDTTNSEVTLGFSMPFLADTVTQYKGYQALCEFTPLHFGDPQIYKQTAEMAFIFNKNNFYSATGGFRTDISGGLDTIDFLGKGPEFWGAPAWGIGPWSGLGNDDPQRIILPRNKQRCRYLTCQFSHSNARESFKLLGISVKMRPFSTKAYS